MRPAFVFRLTDPAFFFYPLHMSMHATRTTSMRNPLMALLPLFLIITGNVQGSLRALLPDSPDALTRGE